MKRVFLFMFGILFVSTVLTGCETTPKKVEKKAAAPVVREEPVYEEPTPETVQVEIVLSDVFFDYNKFSLKSDAKRTLKENAAELKKDESAVITISGHCDERGSNAYNISLGEKRADEVKRFLVGLGVDASRIRVESYGEEKPVCYESTEACWKKNRRAEFEVR